MFDLIGINFGPRIIQALQKQRKKKLECASDNLIKLGRMEEDDYCNMNMNLNMNAKNINLKKNKLAFWLS